MMIRRVNHGHFPSGVDTGAAPESPRREERAHAHRCVGCRADHPDLCAASATCKHSGRSLRNALSRLKALRRLRLMSDARAHAVGLSVPGQRYRAVLEAGAGVPVTGVAEC
jgi:hypothetical protein